MVGARGVKTMIASVGRWRRAAWSGARRAVGRKRSARPAAVDLVAGQIVSTIGVDDLTWLENAYDLETDGTLRWRWTGPGSSFTLIAGVDRSSPLKAILEVQDSTTAINWENTFLECDGVMSLCAYSQRNGLHFLTAAVPARSGPASALIRFHLQECRRPAGGQDGRQLGFRVGALHFARV